MASPRAQAFSQFANPNEEDEKFRRRSSTGFRKSKSQVGRDKRKLDSRHYTMCVGSCFLIFWGLSATVLLLRLGIMYTFDTIRLTREEYAANGAAEWAKTKASRD